MFRDENVILFLVRKSGWCILCRFGHFCRLDSLALAAHEPLLHFLGFREVLGTFFTLMSGQER